MESKNSIVVGIVALIVGLGIGHFMAGKPDTASTAGHETGSMAADLASKTGAAFEIAFIDEMIVHHQGAIDMAKLIPERSTRPELLKLGTDIISAQTSEIQMMQQWKTQWTGQTSAESGSMMHDAQ